MDAVDQARRPRRKRKADSQDNERLSKRLSLLNLERNGSKLYVPVESPAAAASHNASTSTAPATALPSRNDSMMQVDDSKHKVYIYNLDDELSSESEPEDNAGKLILLPDIEKHLYANRIPPVVKANSDGELAGMQLVLYHSAPSSLTVPQERDSVRKAIIEARARFREKQREGRDTASTATSARAPSLEAATDADSSPQMDQSDPDAMDCDE